ncbi:MAG: DUF1294 domain-containing protein [Verrucomicrobiales bacterium]|nr:DUF1294 domain-containing protein [Verrucomicrobiales bacterium]
MSRRPGNSHAGSPPALAFGLGLSAAATTGLVWGLNAAPSVGWLASITVVTLAVFGVDKWAARSNRRRVSEFDLLMLVLLGGTLGALVAMPLFRHKTLKTSFRWRFWAVIVLQALLVVGWLLLWESLGRSR